MRFERAIGKVLASTGAILLAACAPNQSPRPAVTKVKLKSLPMAVDRPAPARLWPRYTLRAEKVWQLNLPQGQPFDASGLLLSSSGDLLTVNDRGAAVYRIRFLTGTNAAELIPLTECFTDGQLAPWAAEKIGRYDCEGIAQDSQNRLYICEEANRWVLRYDFRKQMVERLPIDWSPVQKYFHDGDRNASWEGIAVGNGKLFVANERQLGRIIAVDLKTLKVIDSFAVRPSTSNARDVHYSDLCWFEGALFVLLRESRVVLQVDAETHRVLAEFDYADIELASETIYKTIFRYPLGTMEGLAVDRDHIWLVTDNNGLGRARYPKDLRPTLFKCPRPDRP
ncbi:MAG: esterase-like activity of phytase family protein [Chloroflexi bacterium]|nr:esterase-like activity of phytase family protein [Chloroflexota bacterium]